MANGALAPVFPKCIAPLGFLRDFTFVANTSNWFQLPRAFSGEISAGSELLYHDDRVLDRVKGQYCRCRSAFEYLEELCQVIEAIKKSSWLRIAACCSSQKNHRTKWRLAKAYCE
jgi:hypothetical protein